ncbi:MAG: hypothetical protein KDA79_00470 [Planctomycetaceae bacterium]|nr:hypothetical protein [Planctomycetaceae bacterium]
MSSEDEEQAAAAAVPTAESVEPPVPQAPRQKLVLSLEPGQRFPLLKTVSQTLMQGPSVSRSWLELLMVLTVEEVIPSDDPRAELAGRRRLGVRYQRVRYSHDIAGHRVVYNSTDSGREIPVDALPWHGLVNNSFSFWIGPDNQLVELVGFDEFLARCVRDVPAEHRRQVIETLGETASQKHEGVANLVDDSIGMLPAGTGADGGAWLTPGDRWTRERHVVRPIPMSLSNTYLLTQLTDQYAEIDVSGTIGAGVTFGPLAEQYSRVSVKVRGGQTAGVCRIDRRTGLPIHSQIDRTIQMSATAPDGSAFDQTKHIRSTIAVFQPGGEVHELAGPAPRGALNGPGEAREKPRQEIIPAGAEAGSGAVRQAVYSDSPDAVQRPQ